MSSRPGPRPPLSSGTGITADVTFGSGCFYKKGIQRPEFCFDLAPRVPGVVQADVCRLPLEDSSVFSVMFDPPFMARTGPGATLKSRFGELVGTIKDLWNFYFRAMREIHRVLAPGGWLVFKCQDGVLSGVNNFTHAEVYDMAASLGFKPVDLFILLAKHRMMHPKHKVQKHARKFHSYFWVFRKGDYRLDKVSKWIYAFAQAFLDKNYIPWQVRARTISITNFSALVSPPAKWLMGAFQVQSFVDNSGDEIDPQHKVCSVAGYVTTVKKWRKFEKLWNKVLRKYKVKYLHMKDFAHHNPPFDKFWDKELNKEKPERKEFLQDLINVMVDCQLKGVVAVTVLNDLNRFNAAHNLKIDALALNLYTCMLFLDYYYPNTVTEMVVDKLERPWSIIDTAKDYAKTDIVFPGKCDYIQPHPLNEKLDFEKVPAIQAADFLAWEARKDITTKKGWHEKYRDIEDIKKLCNYDINRYQYPRKSYEHLMKSIPPEGILWDYKWLDLLNKSRQSIWP